MRQWRTRERKKKTIREREKKRKTNQFIYLTVVLNATRDRQPLCRHYNGKLMALRGADKMVFLFQRAFGVRLGTIINRSKLDLKYLFGLFIFMADDKCTCGHVNTHSRLDATHRTGVSRIPHGNDINNGCDRYAGILPGQRVIGTETMW